MMTDVRLHQPAVETRCYISQCLRQQHITQSDITYIMLRDFLFMNLFYKLHERYLWEISHSSQLKYY